MCSRTSASRDRRAAMMFHYIDYADTKVRMRNRQRERNEEREKENRKSSQQTYPDRKWGERQRECRKAKQV